MKEFAYASRSNEELYNGTFDTFDEAAAELDGQGGFVGELVPFHWQTAGHAERILEQMNEWAYDVLGEGCPEGPEGTKEQVAELDAAISATIQAWIDKHNLQCTVKAVENIMSVPSDVEARQTD